MAISGNSGCPFLGHGQPNQFEPYYGSAMAMFKDYF
jgi:hypothetical protein